MATAIAAALLIEWTVYEKDWNLHSSDDGEQKCNNGNNHQDVN